MFLPGLLVFAVTVLAGQDTSPRHLFRRDPEFVVDASCTGSNLAILNKAIPDATTYADAAFTLVSALFGTSAQRAAVNAVTPQVEALLVALFDPMFQSDPDDLDKAYEADDESSNSETVNGLGFAFLPVANSDHPNPGNALTIKQGLDVQNTWDGPTKIFCGEDFIRQSEFASLEKCDRAIDPPLYMVFAYLKEYASANDDPVHTLLGPMVQISRTAPLCFANLSLTPSPNPSQNCRRQMLETRSGTSSRWVIQQASSSIALV
ncbi:hypothetical protein LTR10_008107 [Elasticomyces elasticus]|nr:hypothetical protein LTR10_008107 [Elasticomyces elasticus]KAK4971104.1 hypothetical protein LTR42_008083 [Elasticomyces elasticus]